MCYLTGSITCPQSAREELRLGDLTSSQGHELGCGKSGLQPCLIPEPRL